MSEQEWREDFRRRLATETQKRIDEGYYEVTNVSRLCKRCKAIITNAIIYHAENEPDGDTGFLVNCDKCLEDMSYAMESGAAVCISLVNETSN